MSVIDEALAWVDAYHYGEGEDQSVESMVRFRLMASEIRALRAEVQHWKTLAESAHTRRRKPAVPRMRLWT